MRGRQSSGGGIKYASEKNQSGNANWDYVSANRYVKCDVNMQW